VTGAPLLAGYGADLAFGDPRRWHPVAGFGQAAIALERRTYAPSRRNGAVHAVALVGLAAAGAGLATRIAGRAGVGRGAVLAAATWVSLGGRSLVCEARAVAAHLERDDLEAARRAIPALVGRDPSRLDAAELSRATIESVAENTADAVVGALVWGAIAGAPGVLAYRAANTLDAMIGRRNERYGSFGWAAARLDDLMSWPGARLGAAWAIVLAPLVEGSPRAAWRVTRRDGSAHPSPNAGQIEAAFAGALGLRLGGPLTYDGRVEERPTLGDGRAPRPDDILRAARLSLAVGIAAALQCAWLRARLTRGAAS
jgi:adenosylcobinamide-phosphate synthase